MGCLAVANSEQLFSNHLKDIKLSSYPLYENHPDDSFAQFLDFMAKHKSEGYVNHAEFEHRLKVFR